MSRFFFKNHSMISHCSPFWRKNTGEYPAVSIKLIKYPFKAVEKIPFRGMDEIISERVILPGSKAIRLYCASTD